MEPAALAGLSEATLFQLTEIVVATEAIASRALPLDADALGELIDAACTLLPKFLKGPKCKRNNYSFATKFLHWCCPSALPPVDKYARKEINRLAGNGTIWMPGSGMTTTSSRCTQSYEALIRFYNGALSQLADDERLRLQEHDLRTQPKLFRRRNSLVRILDKYLWLEGKPPPFSAGLSI
jgi:hypothetical protein